MGYVTAGGSSTAAPCTPRGGGTSDDGYRGSITLLPNKPEFIGCDIIDPIGTYWETSNGNYYLFGANGKVVTD